MMVKVCGVTNEDDARMAADAGASAVGFNFYLKSPRYVDPRVAGDIAGRLGRGVLKVGIFVDEPSEVVARIAGAVGLDVVQLYGTSESAGIRSWRCCRMTDAFGPEMLADDRAEAFLLDAPSAIGLHGGTGATFDWRKARGLGKRIILAGGLDASNVREAIESAEPWGVDACSRLESSAGKKDARKVREFVKAALNL